MLSCWKRRWLRARYTAFLEGDLEPDEAQAFRLALANDPVASDELARLQAVAETLRTTLAPAPPADYLSDLDVALDCLDNPLRERFSDLLDEAVSPAELDELRAAIAAEPTLADEFALVAAVDAAVRELPPVPVPAGFRLGLNQQLDQLDWREPRRAVAGNWRRPAVAAAGLAAVGLLIVSRAEWPTPAPSTGPPAVAVATAPAPLPAPPTLAAPAKQPADEPAATEVKATEPVAIAKATPPVPTADPAPAPAPRPARVATTTPARPGPRPAAPVATATPVRPVAQPAVRLASGPAVPLPPSEPVAVVTTPKPAVTASVVPEGAYSMVPALDSPNEPRRPLPAVTLPAKLAHEAPGNQRLIPEPAELNSPAGQPAAIRFRPPVNGDEETGGGGS